VVAHLVNSVSDVCYAVVNRRRTEVSNEDDDVEDDTEFAPSKKIKLEDAANSTGEHVPDLLLMSSISEADVACVDKGVPWQQPHRRSGLSTLPSVGAIP